MLFRRGYIVCLAFFVLLLCQVIDSGNGEAIGDDVEQPASQPIQPLIVGGQETHISKYPYVVSIRRKACNACAFEHYCGGTIFTDDVIITAANCVRTAEVHHTHIIVGSSYRTGSLQDGGMIFLVDKIVLHQNVSIDLALLHLTFKIPLNNSLSTRPIALATTKPRPGASATIVGWGQIQEAGAYSERLREARVRVFNHEECQRMYEFDVIREHEICAGFEDGGTDTCRGDAGGPLLVNNRMVGVASWGYGCARPGKPGVYTNVIDFSEWIVSHALGVHWTFL